MKLSKFLILSAFLAIFSSSCEKDEEEDPAIEVRDPAEQEAEDQEALEAYLATHFYNYEEFENPSADFNYVIELDTINEANADKTPLIESDLLESIIYTSDGIDYTIYILKVREGAEEQPKFSDSTLVSYRGELLNRASFDNALTPVWFDLAGIIPGFAQGVSEFKGASGFEVNADQSVTWNNDFGIGAIFMPSGLGYFAQARPVIPAYSPLIFAFHLYEVNEADHDRDGIPSWMEDLDGDKDVNDEDTDGDGAANFADPDDDGDFIPTREEITIEEDGTITFPDTDNDGTPDYLDPDS